jgi:hypothetical protein
MARVAVVMFEEVCQRLVVLKGDQGQENVAGQGEIECGVGFAMAVPVFLPEAGIPFVVIAVFYRPRLAGGVGGTGFLVGGEAGEEEAGVAFAGLKWSLFLGPVALDGDRRAGPRQAGADGGDGSDGTAPPVQSSVLAFLAQCKRGVDWRLCWAAARRWEVFSLVPTR